MMEERLNHKKQRKMEFLVRDEVKWGWGGKGTVRVEEEGKRNLKQNAPIRVYKTEFPSSLRRQKRRLSNVPFSSGIIMCSNTFISRLGDENVAQARIKK